MSEKLQSIGVDLLPVIAYGDALGLPVEKKTAEQIGLIYGWIKRLEDITENPFIGQYPAGTWSDDTQLSLAVAKGLIAAGDFRMDAMVQSHVDALNEDTMGWGGSTTKSVKRLRDGAHWSESGEAQGRGNGVLMKMAPLVYWQEASGVSSTEADEQIRLLTQMTHDNDLSVINSLTHAEVLRRLIRHDQYPTPDLINRAIVVSSELEVAAYGDESKTTALLDDVARRNPDWTPGSGLALRRQLHSMQGFHSSETLAMAYGAFCMQRTFPASAIEAVNLGGDTDSIGSITAAMSLFDAGAVEHPTDFEKIDRLDELREVSQQLARLALAR